MHVKVEELLAQWARLEVSYRVSPVHNILLSFKVAHLVSVLFCFFQPSPEPEPEREPRAKGLPWYLRPHGRRLHDKHPLYDDIDHECKPLKRWNAGGGEGEVA